MNLDIGQQIAKCEILESVGNGNNGVVYKAKHLVLNKIVALKILQFENAPSVWTALLLQLKSSASLEHPNILPIYDIGEEAGVYYIIRQFIDGDNLLDKIQKQQRINWEWGLMLALEMAKALHAAHTNGILHRNLKPSNVLISNNQEIKLSDFSLIIPGQIGSPLYISPEEIIGQNELDVKSDLYSFGTVLYHALTGEPPYFHQNMEMILQQHISSPIPLVRDKAADIPEEIESLIQRLMAKNPDERFPSALELLQELEKVQNACLAKKSRVSSMVKLGQISGTSRKIQRNFQENAASSSAPKRIPLPQLIRRQNDTSSGIDQQRNSPNTKILTVAEVNRAVTQDSNSSMPLGASNFASANTNIASNPTSVSNNVDNQSPANSGFPNPPPHLPPPIHPNIHKLGGFQKLPAGLSAPHTGANAGTSKVLGLPIPKAGSAFSGMPAENAAVTTNPSPTISPSPKVLGGALPPPLPIKNLNRPMAIPPPSPPLPLYNPNRTMPPPPLDNAQHNIPSSPTSPTELSATDSFGNDKQANPLIDQQAMPLATTEASNTSVHESHSTTADVQSVSDIYQASSHSKPPILPPEPTNTEAPAEKPISDIYQAPSRSNKPHILPPPPMLPPEPANTEAQTDTRNRGKDDGSATKPRSSRILNNATTIERVLPGESANLKGRNKNEVAIVPKATRKITKEQRHAPREEDHRVLWVATIIFFTLVSGLLGWIFLPRHLKKQTFVPQLQPYLEQNDFQAAQNYLQQCKDKLDAAAMTKYQEEIRSAQKNYYEKILNGRGWFGEAIPEGMQRGDAVGLYRWGKDDSIMVYIPAGEFFRGTDKRRKDERPLRRIMVTGFYMDKYELSIQQYRNFLTQTGKLSTESIGSGSLPMFGITWEEAKSYAAWAEKRIPTEAEWEKAARGGSMIPLWDVSKLPISLQKNPKPYRFYPWGDEAPDTAQSYRCNYYQPGVNADGHATLSPVGTFPIGDSPYRCSDMAGNVMEWCNDFYSDRYYSESPNKNPVGPIRGNTKVCRGGAFDCLVDDITCIRRWNYTPKIKYDNLGVRFAK